MMISFILIQNVGLILALPNRRDPVRFEVVNIERTSHPIFELFFLVENGTNEVRHGNID